ncbi:SPOR domain-containing protein [Alteromonas sp. 5E99-2]|uniref:SPOR domain-containing protein n=1 Tax=Alteromonas sp. 5E99-2 TaxID=2817683 RepID=UPI001A9A165D|nr:SPOR domain-containing protein [Alteromonas sp. 5E99-2]MBO1256340.1 SPOR domain-containing protein [Alteromonas sp. 5E99-2]
MTSALKNRLVGTVIVVALVVIFLPNFLDGKKEKNALNFEPVPSIPDKKPIINPEPFPSERVEENVQRPIEIVSENAKDEEIDIAVAQSQQIDNEETDKQTAKRNKTLAEQTVIEAPQRDQQSAGWVVQLGSFRHEKNVRLLLDKLEASGYIAFSRPIQTQSGLLTKVFVGPDLQKSKLEGALPHLKEITGLNGKVTPFTVQP